MIIRNYAGETLLTTTGSSLSGADLQGANLRDADLRNADLRDADLMMADLMMADLTGAKLTGAYLTGVNLMEADLRMADLTSADLTRANLQMAHLRGADLTGAIMPDGRTWEAYQADPLAGICDDQEARTRALSAWNSHSWFDCPMHTAYGWKSVEDAPETKRLLVSTFIALFDSWLLKDSSKKAKA